MDNIRLSFLGDIMFEKYSLEKNHENTDFKAMLRGIKPLLKKTDILIGNVETTFSGKDKGYTNEMYSFNTPDNAIEGLKEIGLDYAIITNNHILDRGMEGRKRTIQKLSENNIKVLAKDDKIDVLEYKGIKFSLLPYTSTTNYLDNKVSLTKDEENEVRLLCQYDYSASDNQEETTKQKIFNIIQKSIGYENSVKLLKALGKRANSAYADNINENKSIDSYIERVEKDLAYARKHSDYTIVLPHMGGQFNLTVGSFSEMYMNIFNENKADFIIGSHPHIIQKYEKKDYSRCFFSIGNVSMAQNSTYIIKDNNPEIGIVVHLNFSAKNKKFNNISISPFKILDGKTLRLSILNNNAIIDLLNIKLWLEKRLGIKLEYKDNEFLIIE